MDLGDPSSPGTKTQEVSWKAHWGTGCVWEGTADSSEPQAQKPGEVSSPRGTPWQPGEPQLIHHLCLAEL